MFKKEKETGQETEIVLSQASDSGTCSCQFLGNKRRGILLNMLRISGTHGQMSLSHSVQQSWRAHTHSFYLLSCNMRCILRNYYLCQLLSLSSDHQFCILVCVISALFYRKLFKRYVMQKHIHIMHILYRFEVFLSRVLVSSVSALTLY